jgi:hypothetical protein
MAITSASQVDEAGSITAAASTVFFDFSVEFG